MQKIKFMKVLQYVCVVNKMLCCLMYVGQKVTLLPTMKFDTFRKSKHLFMFLN